MVFLFTNSYCTACIHIPNLTCWPHDITCKYVFRNDCLATNWCVLPRMWPFPNYHLSLVDYCFFSRVEALWAFPQSVWHVYCCCPSLDHILTVMLVRLQVYSMLNKWEAKPGTGKQANYWVPIKLWLLKKIHNH